MKKSLKPKETIIINCPEPGDARKEVRRQMIEIIRTFEESRGANLLIVGFTPYTKRP
jgi:hypothetical protein